MKTCAMMRAATMLMKLLTADQALGVCQIFENQTFVNKTTLQTNIELQQLVASGYLTVAFSEDNNVVTVCLWMVNWQQTNCSSLEQRKQAPGFMTLCPQNQLCSVSITVQAHCTSTIVCRTIQSDVAKLLLQVLLHCLHGGMVHKYF